MLGLMKITKGDIYINGYNVAKDFEKAIARIGGIIESPELYKYLSGYANLKFFARLRGDIPRERIDEIVEFVGLKNRIHDKVRKYSLGMRQRLGVAQALLHDPNILVLDEPTNGLDPAGIKELRDTFKKLAREKNVAVFVSSHLLSEMQLMCDRAAIIQNGRVVKVLDMRDAAVKAVNTQIFTVSPVEKAVEAITAYGKYRIIGVQGNDISVEMDAENVNEIVQVLIPAGVMLKGVRAVEKTLEDLFMETTGVNVID